MNAPFSLSPIPLRITRSAGEPRTAVALLLPGEDPAAWLAELVAGPASLSDIELYRLPRGAGLLALRPTAIRNHTGRGLGFGRLGAHLLLPVDAVIEPPISAAEADRLFGRWRLVVWHPAVGPCGFDQEDAVALNELLAPPWDRRAPSWNAAPPGPDPLPALRAIQFATPLPPEAIFGESAREIGSDPVRPATANALPPRAGEPSDARGPSTARGLKLAALRTLARLIQAVPPIATKPTWINAVEDWLGRKLSGLRRELDQLRHRAIDRLLHQLDQDPDAGLRHAIPLGGLAGAASRGVATPGWTLGNRETDFGLAETFATRPSDSWDIDPARTERLRALYHQLAQREIQLGRHRRAAFIYAQLLRDLSSAASTLLAGKFHREAAVLYQDHLQNRLLAARAWEAGGFFEEALPHYEALEEWRAVARLHRALGNEAGAQAAWRREVARMLAVGERVGAATVLESELGAPREAAEVLRAGWPDSPAAGRCLKELFALQQRQHWEAEADALLAEVCDEEITTAQAVLLAQTLGEVRSGSLSASLRVDMTDAVRVIVARHLPTAEKSPRANLVQCLVRLAPEDRVLGRDAGRFLMRPAIPLPAPVRPPDPPSVEIQRGVRLVGTIGKGRALQHAAVVGSSDGYAVAGVENSTTLALRCARWGGEEELFRWPVHCTPGVEPLLVEAVCLSPERRTSTRLVLAPSDDWDASVWAEQASVQRTSQGHPSFVAGTPEWWPDGTFAAAFIRSGFCLLRHGSLPDEWLMARHSADGNLLGTTPLPSFGATEPGFYSIAAHESGPVAAGIGGVLCLLERKGGDPALAMNLDGPIVAIRPTARHARAGFLITTTTDVWLIWHCTADTKIAESRGGRIRAEFTGGGDHVVVADAGSIRVFAVGYGGDAREIAEFQSSARSVIGVTPCGPGPNDFALFGDDGTVERYRVG